MSASYLTAIEARQFATQRGFSAFQNLDDESLNRLLIRASEWLDSSFVFAGEKYNAAQMRAFPRYIEGKKHINNSVPHEVIQAVIEIALALAVSDHEAELLLGFKGPVMREQIGDISVSYQKGKQKNSSRIAILLTSFLRSSSATRILRQ